MTTPSALLFAARSAIRAALPGPKIDVVDRQWGNREKDAQAIRAPAVLLTCMRMVPEYPTHDGDFDVAQLVAICVVQCSDNVRDPERTKALSAMDLASQVSVVVRDAGTWDGAAVKRAERVRVDPIAVRELEDKGYAAWGVYWDQLFDPHAPFDASEYGPLHAVNNTFATGDENTPDKQVTYTATGAP